MTPHPSAAVTLAALRELLERGTKGPWEAYGDNIQRVGADRRYRHDGRVLDLEYGYYGEASIVMSEEDRALIVAAVNALPALLACAEAAKEVAELDSDTPEHARLRTALEAIR